MKIYLVVAVWGNTKDNHAGMYYLAKQLKNKYPTQVRVLPTPTKGSRFLYPFYRMYNIILGVYLWLITSKKDCVFLMEYLLPETEQSDIALVLHKKIKVVGLAHLVPDRIDKFYSKNKLQKKISYCSRVYVFGNSLKKYLLGKGIEETKIITTFHYVDNNYYAPSTYGSSKRLKIICMGNMERDFETLLRIIIENPEMDFILCKGNHPIPREFEDCDNLKILGFVSEKELLLLMQQSDISLNVMRDTIGSNVITTSLACGLIVLASDVGSINDYIADGVTGLLFNSVQECREILQNLDKNREIVSRIKKAAREKSEDISLVSFQNWFKHEFIR